jgi:hypothetical protein
VIFHFSGGESGRPEEWETLEDMVSYYGFLLEDHHGAGNENTVK